MDRRTVAAWGLACALSLGPVDAAPAQVAVSGDRTEDPVPVIAVHGGAGNIRRGDFSPKQEAEYLAALEDALRAGQAILEAGGSSVDAVVEAVRRLEDSPLFNAGRGSVFTATGTHELDASVMDGRDRAAGAVAAVHRVKNPVVLARAVMELSPHVLLVGDGAEAFAVEQGIELVDPSYFFSQARWAEFERVAGRPPGGGATAFEADGAASEGPGGKEFGTVGAVAMDRDGDLAAATSTGGMTNKRVGRVGDSPIIGAGTYAENGVCAVSATGHGEFFIRNVVAYDICAMVRYTGIPLADAADQVVMERLVAHGGAGGVIAIDASGNIAMPFNTPGMFRGAIDAAGNVVVEIYPD